MSEVRGELVRWFDDRGFGFLKRDDGDGKDVFVGARDLRVSGIHDPREGQRFVFAVESDSEGRYRAADIRREGSATAARQVFEPVRQR